LKGQTALEYLITYGWAIIVILVVLAVLWYYGIFTPSKWQGQGNCSTILEKYNVSSCNDKSSLTSTCQYQNKTCDCFIVDKYLAMKCTITEDVVLPPNA